MILDAKEREKRYTDKGHTLERDEDGDVHWFVVDSGFHNGPRCKTCDESWCDHCATEIEQCARPSTKIAMQAAEQPSAEPFAYAYRTRGSGGTWLFSKEQWPPAGYFCQDPVVEVKELSVATNNKKDYP